MASAPRSFASPVWLVTIWMALLWLISSIGRPQHFVLPSFSTATAPVDSITVSSEVWRSGCSSNPSASLGRTM